MRFYVFPRLSLIMHLLTLISSVLTPSVRKLGLVCAASAVLGLGAAAQAATPSSSQGKPVMDTNPRVDLHTNMGDIVIELNAEKAPKTVENFLSYVKEGFYDNTIFHRVIDNLMVQGGGFEPGMKQKQPRSSERRICTRGVITGRLLLS